MLRQFYSSMNYLQTGLCKYETAMYLIKLPVRDFYGKVNGLECMTVFHRHRGTVNIDTQGVKYNALPYYFWNGWSV